MTNPGLPMSAATPQEPLTMTAKHESDIRYGVSVGDVTACPWHRRSLIALLAEIDALRAALRSHGEDGARDTKPRAIQEAIEAVARLESRYPHATGTNYHFDLGIVKQALSLFPADASRLRGGATE